MQQTYKPRFREESFAYIVSFSDGTMDFYDKACKPILDANQFNYNKLDEYRIGDLKNILRDKKNKTEKIIFDKDLLNSPNPLKAPISVSIEITRECNLRCNHCSIKAGEKRKDEMSTELIKSLMVQLKEAGVMSLFITGGECTLHKDFVEICQFADELDIDCFVQSNGIGITRALLEQMPKSIYFVIGFDGLYSYNKLHKSTVEFSTYEHLFEMFQELEIPFSLTYVAIKDNIAELPKTYQYCAQHKIDLSALDLFPTGRALLHPEIYPSITQADDIKKLAKAKYEYEKKQQKFETEIYHNAPNPYHFAFIQKLQEIFKRSFPGVFTAYIASDGTVYPDVMHAGENSFPQGNVKTDSFMTIWEEKFKDIRELVRWENWKHCNECKLYNQFCDYRLPVLSNNLYQVYNYCGTTEEHIEIMNLRYWYREETKEAYSNDKAREIDFW